MGWSLAAHGLLLCGVILWPYLRPRPVITLPAVVEVDLLQLEKPKPPPKPAPRPVPKPKPKPKPKPEPAPKPKPAPPPEPAPKPEPKPEPPPPPDPVAVAPEPKPEPEIPPPPPTPEPEPQMAAEVEVIPPALAWYLEQVRRGIWSQWLDPGSLLDLDELARVIVRFELGREGQVVSGPTVLEGSGNALFDQSGVRAVLRAAPFPPMPAEHPDGTLGIRFTFVYGDQTEG